jgi:glycerol-3-phosphate dehydrogenase (NAD(P)+)
MTEGPTDSLDVSDAARVTVVGGGAWGTTLAALASVRGPTVLWVRESDVVATIRDDHQNRRFLPGFDLPVELEATSDLEGAVTGAHVVVVASPAQFVRAVMAQASTAVSPDALIVSVTKGFEVSSSKRMTEVLADVLPDLPAAAIGVLAGPNLAREVIAGHPSATTVAFADPAAATAVQSRLSGPTFRVYTSTDVVGCEIGGAAKNVIAIAAGVVDGLGYGMNTMAALVTRGAAEVARLGVALGGDPLTFLGLAGNGDLIATCNSRLSRNHQVGRQLAAGVTIEEIVGGMTAIAEGVAATPVLLELARSHGVEMPIAETVAAVLDRRIGPAEALAQLMDREPRHELHGLHRRSAPRDEPDHH